MTPLETLHENLLFENSDRRWTLDEHERDAALALVTERAALMAVYDAAGDLQCVGGYDPESDTFSDTVEVDREQMNALCEALDALEKTP